ncbi:MAG TPA: hypothetical protein VG222_13875, partial [Vicinamibacterales bacterium]|nr:hypothetical protein [Vicinamibacterales bacterium]
MKRTLILFSLAALITSAAACGSSSNVASPTTPTPPAASPTPSAPNSPSGVIVSIRGELGNQSFAPNPTTMKVGQTIAWQNTDSITHT